MNKALPNDKAKNFIEVWIVIDKIYKIFTNIFKKHFSLPFLN